ncbi:hypothetical protein BS627_04740 [Agrobacterium salinitolerans]|uniref:hypothetical protein n=1 Tax=Agrobacterium salinitolerans TaxID=1183413 RepID=UPI00098FB845|nr:hypothetical protein [Agrobacterium salinitolerans]OOO26361.1 hypothetical protein BS627_04740 [Agrobacterium salinitolerans]PNQ24544.1 hypothetical protein C2E26_04825 [Rhizobium sp. YIC5082]
MNGLWQNSIATVGVVSGLLSIIAMIAPFPVRESRVAIGLYVIVVAILATFATHFSSRLTRIEEVSRVADQMVKERQVNYTHRAFVLASLSFLEKNKDLFPDTYDRAKKLCETFRCGDPEASLEMIELSYTMAGIVRGLGTMSSSK